MEMGGPIDEMVFDDFDHLKNFVEKLSIHIEERKIMTASEHKKLKSCQLKIKLYVATPPSEREALKCKLDHLLKTYSTYYDA
ncbi:MAG: hypothetical protein S4CHLAM7_05250 [Chlamydiae bacterium]|nr:hypothetical protein [Chlamydiota bacterium]